MELKISKKDQVRNFISETTFTDLSKIEDSTLLFEEGIFDSLGFLSLITYLDQEFSVEVANDELIEENFESIKAIVAFIDRKKNLH